MNTDKTFFITTAIDYINGKPHIGHAYEKVAADVLARYYRSKGFQVNFLTGTDEHGAKIEKFAKTSNLPIEQFVKHTAAGFKLAWDNLSISYDRFIRTTDDDHEETVKNFVTKIKDSGFLYEGDYEGLYCIGHEAFMTEKELVNGVCPEHQKPPEKISEKNWFFQISQFTQQIKSEIESNKLKIYPEHSRAEILSMLNEGFHDLAITRPNVKWGIDAPWDESQTIYVWVDALINYYSGRIQDGQDCWPADMHVIGPDIAKFHCIIWPALLLAAGLELPKQIAVHGFLTLNGQKISKSLGNIIDPNDWVEKYGSDAVRYFILREVPFSSHGDLSESKLVARINGDLANGLGNLVSRITTLIEKNLDGKIIPIDISEFNVEVSEIEQDITNFKFHDALGKIFSLIAKGNKIVDENKLWDLAKTDVENFTMQASKVIGLLKLIGSLLQFFMPNTALIMAGILNADKITKAPPLFERVKL